MTEPTDPSRHDDAPLDDEAAALTELDHDPHTRAEIRHARRAFLMEAAIEAERALGVDGMIAVHGLREPGDYRFGLTKDGFEGYQ